MDCKTNKHNIEEKDNNNNMVIEDGEVVVPLILEDERKKEEEEEVVGDRFIIDKNWILDCECIDENNKKEWPNQNLI